MTKKVIKKIFDIFDYIFYRIAEVYFKWDENSASTAIIAVAMLQTLIISDITGFILQLFYKRAETMQFVKTAKIIGGSLFLLLCFLNYLRYKSAYNDLKTRWINEPIQRRKMLGKLTIIALIIPWIALIVLGRTGLK
ncbi:hypothetical protein FLJC2902T_31900 [Flavobacterium limnosediminis JC2902]|uniref:Uncharacterized protein n=1 Tax=Flavobacterium limnosediminis JC2902 TaxID=1341181 RepID=V6SDC7_9FLAO|nr:hypothetical protein [Flavobacterium limnosediminis]ESU24658.1 hypothetical protein FLJC2902T_31900 [Flavobacterium limnosediminis JC2902]